MPRWVAGSDNGEWWHLRVFEVLVLVILILFVILYVGVYLPFVAAPAPPTVLVPNGPANAPGPAPLPTEGGR
jgi:hypothetical protein